MVVTGVTGVCIRGTYGDGLVGRAWARRHLDTQLLEAAARAGVDVRTSVRVLAPLRGHDGRVEGVRVRLASGRDERIAARWTIAADGRRSPLAIALGLIAHPVRPRRWAIGTYAEGVDGLGAFGEMHVRAGHYIGVAPAADGLANLCLVTSSRDQMSDPGARLWDAVRRDPLLRDRCARARQVAGVVTLGPLAVDARAVGMPGLLLAGDAAGFVDPMTGDGIHIALRGGLLAAEVLLDVAGERRSPRWSRDCRTPGGPRSAPSFDSIASCARWSAGRWASASARSVRASRPRCSGTSSRRLATPCSTGAGPRPRDRRIVALAPDRHRRGVRHDGR